MKRRIGYNPKRRVVAADACSQAERARLAENARYTGNPEHKRQPGDFGLTPPCSPRPGKTLCDEAGVLTKEVASALLRAGFEKGLVSVRHEGTWPQNVWSVSGTLAFEAQLENQAQGTYHGYPMPLDDDFRATILEEWGKR